MYKISLRKNTNSTSHQDKIKAHANTEESQTKGTNAVEEIKVALQVRQPSSSSKVTASVIIITGELVTKETLQ